MKPLKYILAFLFVQVQLNAQENKEANALDHPEPIMNGYEWTPTLLNANSNPLYNAVIYNGSVFSWSLRGAQNVTTIIDGVNWHSPLVNWRPGDLFEGLQREFHKQSVLVNGEFSDMGYWRFPTVQMVSTKLGITNKSSAINLGISNSMYANSIRLHHQNGENGFGWRASTGINLQYSSPGFVFNGYAKLAGIVFSMDKDFGNGMSAGWTIIWNYSDRSKATTTVNEMYELAKQRTYNSSWGWHQRQMLFPNTKQSNAPVISFRLLKEWDENNALHFDNAVVYGNQAQSNLEWTHTADPRPDYYRYLPSYAVDSSLQNSLRDWYIAHPEALQINFDKLEKTNASSVDKRSYYIINQQNAQLLLLHGALVASHKFKSNINLLMGADYALDQIHYSNTIKDLLGGNYFFNYNNWINDDGTVVSFQNDIAKPDRKIKEGERWGADYVLRALQVHPWVQLNKQGPNIESFIAFGYGTEGLQRIGMNQNGLFPSQSKGFSHLLFSPYWDIKGQLLFKFSGRLYARSIFYGQVMAPQENSVYIDAAIHSMVSPFLLTEFDKGVDLTLFYRAPSFKASIAGYVKNSANQSEQKMFYHDAYAAFVYGLVGNIEKSFSGIESSFETNLFQNIQVSFASTIEKNVFNNNPSYQLLLVNNLQQIESGLLHLKSLSNSSSPLFVNALSLQYQPVFSIRLGLSIVYAQDRSVSLDYFRRSDWVKNRVDPISWDRIVKPAMLPNKAVANLFVSKFFQFKWNSNNESNHTTRWSTSLSVRNLLDAFIPVIAYEQTRFDYLHFNANKYAIKYLLDQGVRYSFHIQLQIQ